MAEDTDNKIVLDTSVIIKWYALEEEGRANALKIASDYKDGKIEIVMPVFYLWEVNNYLSRYFKMESAYSIYSNLKLLRFKEYELSHSLTKLSFQIIKKISGISFYDASFHALAIQENAILITCDEKYFHKTKKLGHIKLLKNYQ